MNRYKSITIGNNYILDVNGKWVEYKDVEKLLEALKFYANKNNYYDGDGIVDSEISLDEGKRAREDLK